MIAKKDHGPRHGLIHHPGSRSSTVGSPSGGVCFIDGTPGWDEHTRASRPRDPSGSHRDHDADRSDDCYRLEYGRAAITRVGSARARGASSAENQADVRPINIVSSSTDAALTLVHDWAHHRSYRPGPGRKMRRKSVLLVAGVLLAAGCSSDGGGEAASVAPSTSTSVATTAAGGIGLVDLTLSVVSDIAVVDDAVWVADVGAGRVFEVDPETHEWVTASPYVGAFGVAVSGGAVWFSNIDGDYVTRMDLGQEAAQFIDVGGDPTWVAAGEGSVWVVNSADYTVSRVDPAGGEQCRLHGVPGGSGRQRGRRDYRPTSWADLPNRRSGGSRRVGLGARLGGPGAPH